MFEIKPSKWLLTTSISSELLITKRYLERRWTIKLIENNEEDDTFEDYDKVYENKITGNDDDDECSSNKNSIHYLDGNGIQDAWKMAAENFNLKLKKI